MSIGFRRYFVLPKRVRQNIHLAHLLETGSVNFHDRVVNFFGSMNEAQYVNYLKLA